MEALAVDLVCTAAAGKYVGRPPELLSGYFPSPQSDSMVAVENLFRFRINQFGGSLKVNSSCQKV